MGFIPVSSFLEVFKKYQFHKMKNLLADFEIYNKRNSKIVVNKFYFYVFSGGMCVNPFKGFSYKIPSRLKRSFQRSSSNVFDFTPHLSQITLKLLYQDIFSFFLFLEKPICTRRMYE